MNRKISAILLIIFLAAISVSAQTPKENLLEKTELYFALEGEPDASDVGFDNPKSSWKIKYQLFLTEFSELEKLGICRRDEQGKHICPLIIDKKQNKQIKKKSAKLLAGNFTRKFLADGANRKVSIPVNLPPNVIEIFNQATKNPDQNPTFILFITEKVSVKTSAKAKLKQKISVTGIENLKNAMSNQNFEYWDVSCLSLISSIIKQENGQLKFYGGTVRSGCPKD